MAKTITAYQSKDGKVHLDKNEADYSDFKTDIQDDAIGFLKQEKTDDKDGHIIKMLIRWEVYKNGDYSGWIAARQKLAQHGLVLTRADSIVMKPEREALAAELASFPVDAPAAVKAFKKRVGIVGVWPGNQQSIKDDFGDKFDLTIYSADDTSKLGGLKSAHKVFVLKKFTGHKHVEILRSIGQDPMVIGGAMNELKTALRNYAA